MATKRERADVAVACSDSVSYLYQIAGEHRYASPWMATQIERQTRAVADLSDGRLEPVLHSCAFQIPGRTTKHSGHQWHAHHVRGR